MFNKNLSQLEAVFQVEKPVETDPVYVSDFIHHVFENQKKYDVHWGPDTIVTSGDIHNLLDSRGYNVSLTSINEGIEIFKDEI